MNELPQLFNGKLRPINEGQKALMVLVSIKYQSYEHIEYEELRTIYQKKVQRNKHSTYWTRDGWKTVDYADWEIYNLTTSWVLRAIGTLVKKGYLTVIPKINFSKQLK